MHFITYGGAIIKFLLVFSKTSSLPLTQSEHLSQTTFLTFIFFELHDFMKSASHLCKMRVMRNYTVRSNET